MRNDKAEKYMNNRFANEQLEEKCEIKTDNYERMSYDNELKIKTMNDYRRYNSKLQFLYYNSKRKANDKPQNHEQKMTNKNRT